MYCTNFSRLFNCSIFIMPRSRVKVLEAIQAKSNKQTDFKNLVFKVQIGGKDQ